MSLKKNITHSGRVLLEKVLRRVLPRKDDIWVFGARDGEHYDENSKALFEYVSGNAPEIKAVWLTRNKAIYSHLKGKGLNVCMISSVLGYLNSFRAGVAIFSVSKRDVNKPVIEGAKTVQLWHGTPLRDNDIADIGEDYDMVIIASGEFMGNQKLSSKKEYFYALTGYPRNDRLFSPNKRMSERIKEKCDYEKMAIYLPTHRWNVSEKGEFLLGKKFELFGEKFGFDLAGLEQVLEKNKAVFVFKPHPVQCLADMEMVSRISASKRIFLVDPSDPLEDLYDYLGEADVLITDYSSVYFDYLLLNRPIIFAPFDFVEEARVRAMRFPYDEVTPGPKAFTWKEVCSSLDDIFSGKDEWEERRQKIASRFNAHFDDKSSERVYREIKKL